MRIAFFGICILLSSQFTFAQDTSLIKRLEEIEAKEQLEEREHQLRIRELNQAAEQQLQDKKVSLFWWFTGFLGIGTLAGVLTSFFLLPKIIRTKTEKEVEEQIRAALKGRSRDVKKMLEEYSDENYLLNNKKLFVYGEPIGALQKVFNNFDFDPNNILEEPEQQKDCDIIFINNQKGTISKEDLLSLVNAGKKTQCFFYYNENRAFFPIDAINDMDIKARINFATNPAQIYGNLMNTLKYQEKIAN